MQLSLFRLTMVVPLLISAVRIEANPEKFSSISSEKDQAMIKAHEENNSFLKNDIKSSDKIHEQDAPIQKRQLNRNDKFLNERDSKIRRGRMNSNGHHSASKPGTKVLAQKLANEALKSLKMQETMKKLTRVTTPLYETVKVPVVASRNSATKSTTNTKKHRKPSKHKGRRKRKRKRHHRRYRNHARWPKRGPSKKASNTRRDTNLITKGRSENRNSKLKRNQSAIEDKSHTKSSHVQPKVVELIANDYVDFSSAISTQSPLTSTAMRKYRHPIKPHEGESMIARLMKTTSKDPSKKSPGDQGIEYSDYYSDDDVLEDIAANKIQMKLAEPRNPNDRFIRQTINTSSFYNDHQTTGLSPQLYFQDFNKHGRDYKYDDSIESPYNYQTYPINEQSLGLNQNSRFSATNQDPSFNPAPDYGPVLNENNENFDNTYLNNEEIPVSDQPETFDQVTLSDLQNNLDLPDTNKLNKEFQQPFVVLPQYPNEYNYWNQYEKPEINEAQNLYFNGGADQPETGNTKFLDIDKQVGAQENSVIEVPRFSMFSAPQLQNRYGNSEINDQVRMPDTRYDKNEENNDEPQFSNDYNVPRLQNQSPDIDRNFMIQPRVENSRLSGAREEEDETQQPSFQQPLYSGKQDLSQFSNNRYGKPGEQNLKSFSLQPIGVPYPQNKNYDRPNALPSINLPNAMEQPFGKVLESLGINVNGNASVNRDLKSASKENDLDSFTINPMRKISGSDRSLSQTVERPREYFLSPNHVTKKIKEEPSKDYEDSNLKFSDLQRIKYGDDNLQNEAKKHGDRFSSQEEHVRRKVARSRNKIRNNLSQFVEERNSAVTQNSNVSATINETKEVASLLLDTIIDELEELKMDHTKNNKKEGLPCRLSGSWLTSQAGIRLDMKISNHTIIVTFLELASPRFHESFLNGTWNITGHVPFKRGAPFTLIATDNRTDSVAVFVGACRVCQGVDTIAGVWSVARQPKDCRDFQIATSVFNDVFRKTRVSSIKEKQRAIAQDNSFAQNITTSIATEKTTRKNEKRNG